MTDWPLEEVGDDILMSEEMGKVADEMRRLRAENEEMLDILFRVNDGLARNDYGWSAILTSEQALRIKDFLSQKVAKEVE